MGWSGVIVCWLLVCHCVFKEMYFGVLVGCGWSVWCCFVFLVFCNKALRLCKVELLEGQNGAV